MQCTMRIVMIVLLVVVGTMLALDSWPATPEFSAQSPGDSKPAPAIDFDRVGRFRTIADTAVLNEDIRASWVSSTQVVYRFQTSPGTWEFRTANAKSERTPAAFDHESVSKQLAARGEENCSPNALPFELFQTDSQGTVYAVTSQGDVSVIDFGKSTLTSPKLGVATPFDIAPSALLASSQGGPSTRIVFLNESKESITLTWLDDQAKSRSYGEVKAGTSRRIDTFVGHLWSVSSKSKGNLGRYMATERIGVVRIDGTPKSPHLEARNQHWIAPDGVRRYHTQGSRKIRIESGEGPNSKELCSFEITDTEDTLNSRHLMWSPDSRYLIGFRRTPAKSRVITLIETSPKNQVDPVTKSVNYPKPGDPRSKDVPYLIDTVDGVLHDLNSPLIESAWSLTDVEWSPDSKSFSFLYNQRGHKVMHLLEVDVATRSINTLIEEECETFFDYTNKTYLNRFPAKDEALWMSERDGWNHLYLWDTKRRKLKNQITKGDWLVRKVVRVDESKRLIWFSAMGVRRDQDPYHVHFGRIGFDGKGLTWLTDGDGTHSIELSPDGEYVLARHSRSDLAPIHEFRNGKTGKRIAVLAEADATALVKAGWNAPVRLTALGRDGKTPICGHLLFPSWAKPGETFPVIESIYAGPHGHFVPKTFERWHAERELSEIGFVVARIDGMGTNWRSKAFHDVCYKNLADAGLPDRVLWLKAAAKSHPAMDITRVGIYGGSAGGQSAMRALISHHDFYKAAAADCGCHDNRVDKMWWNEMWMGFPVDQSYLDSSNVVHASKMQGALLLTVGELDTNVDPASTMQVVNALIAANKRFDLMVFPGAGHGVGESDYGRALRRDFFIRELKEK